MLENFFLFFLFPNVTSDKRQREKSHVQLLHVGLDGALTKINRSYNSPQFISQPLGSHLTLDQRKIHIITFVCGPGSVFFFFSFFPFFF